MSTIDDFLGWAKADGIEFDDLLSRRSAGGGMFQLELPGGLYTLIGGEEAADQESFLVLQHGRGQELRRGPLRYTTWAKCLGAIVANEMRIEREHDQIDAAIARDRLCSPATHVSFPPDPAAIVREVTGYARCQHCGADEGEYHQPSCPAQIDPRSYEIPAVTPGQDID